ncbi:MAG: hypothetical protein WAN50_04300 [Minisyncoccia bacterium]
MPTGIKETAFDARNYRQVIGELYASPGVGEAEIELARKNIEALEKKASEQCVALYKLEVQFGRDHHVDGTPTYGMLTLWESGTKLHGGGDALLYTCPSKHMGRGTCEGVIPDSMNGRSIVVCPHCLTAWKNTELIGQTYYRLPIQKWAEVVHKWFIRLNMNADIRVKYFYEDIRKATAKEQAKDLQGEALERARSQAQRKVRIYPLANILRDVNAGADMYNRILAFLKE